MNKIYSANQCIPNMNVAKVVGPCCGVPCRVMLKRSEKLCFISSLLSVKVRSSSTVTIFEASPGGIRVLY